MADQPEPVGAGPRADWTCLSKKCRQEDGSAPVYELPTKATRCPCCGSKRIQRLFNSVNVSKSGFYAVNRIVDAEGARQFEKHHDQRDAAIRMQKRGESTFAVPIGNNGAIGAGIAARIPQAAPLFGGLAVAAGAGQSGMPGREMAGRMGDAVVLHKDTTKISKRPDGLVEVKT